MCGRYASFRDAQDLADDVALAELAEDARLLPPSWNVAPTDDVRIVVERPARVEGRSTGEITRSLQVARWGLVPGWAKDPSVGPRMINARSETLLTKRAFAKPLAVRRCLVPADGYYEWRRLPLPPGAAPRAKAAKQPYWIHRGDDPVLLAGLYEFWRDPSRADDDPDRWLVSTTIVTTAASAPMAHLHDRMPVALPGEAWDEWLDPAVGAEQAARLLGSPLEEFDLRPVRPLVSSVRNDGPSLLDPEPEPLDADLPRTPAAPAPPRSR
ncbi:SOS response-associated peptidase [Xylanimonas oleitrophica]|uniref:Abasic site processing protein n=1 Tax=Xylanimonas oleitrophica TaxID=2607479 RepID=A0A2W5X3X5_9MICO|nr:SOS response-associated peptidase [Xylanimonas oleitrophica]PZR55125.1 SOS response-associated peptidase [Xylanimonas oleitrophica]